MAWVRVRANLGRVATAINFYSGAYSDSMRSEPVGAN
jgi:hypothetical protein